MLAIETCPFSFLPTGDAKLFFAADLHDKLSGLCDKLLREVVQVPFDSLMGMPSTDSFENLGSVKLPFHRSGDFTVGSVRTVPEQTAIAMAAGLAILLVVRR